MGEKERIMETIKKVVRGEDSDSGSKDKHTEEYVLHKVLLVADRISIVVKKEEDALDIVKEIRDLLVIPGMSAVQRRRCVKLLEVLVSNCRVLRLAMSKDRLWAEFLHTLVTVRFNRPETREVQTALVTAISNWSSFAFSGIDNEDKLFDQFLALYGDLVKFGVSVLTVTDQSVSKCRSNASEWSIYDGDDDEEGGNEDYDEENNSDDDGDVNDADRHAKAGHDGEENENTIEVRQTENSKRVTFTPRKTKIKLSSNLALANGVRQSTSRSTEEVGWFRSLFWKRSSATPEEIKENGLIYVNELLNYIKILREGRLLLESQIIRANELMSLLSELLKPLTELLNAEFVTKNDKLVMELLDINETAIKAIKEYKVYFDNTYEIIDSGQKSATKPQGNAQGKEEAKERKAETITFEETGLKVNKFPPKPSLAPSVTTPNYDPKVIFTDDFREAYSTETDNNNKSREQTNYTQYTLQDSLKDTFGIDI